MSKTQISPELIRKTIDFHGHSCPGLAIGIRAAEVALREVGRSSDEEVVAVVENDNCAVDAIQFLLSCTYGKGNLIHMDYGKLAFNFYRRSDGKAIRVIGKPEIFGHLFSPGLSDNVAGILYGEFNFMVADPVGINLELSFFYPLCIQGNDAGKFEVVRYVEFFQSFQDCKK